ncbi:group I truncated hemoglobin [Pseudohaliea rubra]|uniref:Cyanoglobin, Hemoglobin-like protein HbN n=1 Tax=Pseudohaliea rubra DSM 19751 TaxID=1265313 RepID=A0A095XSM4_9GAMM|nr:group 1 truncated hemoglobin [Pseudohaliea rubra]KGE02661.1 Cyanoglobin, Hemoglobin-like protein HbN [Pseudohaliea rubra DSM 19751]
MSARGLPLLLAAVLLAACAGSGAEREGTLYGRLGGAAGIEAIVDRFLYHLADNERSLPLFRNTDIERFREKFIEHLCELSDGPCAYSGDSMAATHRGMDITRAQFNSIVETLQQALADTDTPVGARNALLERLAALYREVAEQ